MYQTKKKDRTAPALLLSLTGWLVLVIGCGDSNDSRPTAAFTGIVTFDGRPMEEGSIHFTSPRTGESTSCNLEKGGAYRVTFPGGDLNELYEVTIREADLNPEGTPAHEMKPPPKLTVPLPQKYRLRDTSGLTARLEKAGENKVDFALTSK